MPPDVYWPKQLHALWERVLECERCATDPELRDRINWAQYVPLKTIGILPPGRRTTTYLVLAAEPSGAGKIKNRHQAIERQRAPRGSRNFNGNHGDLALQFALESWLIDGEKGEAFYITDLGKCRVPTGSVARETKIRRYANCQSHLAEELRVLQPQAIIAVGRRAFGAALRQREPGWPAVFEITHYSGVGVSKWKEYLDPGWESGLPSLRSCTPGAASGDSSACIRNRFGAFPRATTGCWRCTALSSTPSAGCSSSRRSRRAPEDPLRSPEAKACGR